MIVSITSQKGGVGKSTLTWNLATLFARDGYKVCIADSDHNQTCLKWVSERQERGQGSEGEKLHTVDVYSTPDEHLRSSIKTLGKQYELILVDGMPTQGSVNGKLLYISDFVVVPLRPSGVDANTLEKFVARMRDIEIERENEIHSTFVMTQFDPRSKVSRIMLNILKAHQIDVCKTTIGSRAIYQESFLEGLGISEMTDERGRLKNQQAADELEALYKEILNKLRTLPYGQGDLFNRTKHTLIR